MIENDYELHCRRLENPEKRTNEIEFEAVEQKMKFVNKNFSRTDTFILLHFSPSPFTSVFE